MHFFLYTILFFLIGINYAYAYIGPGLGLGAIGAFFGAVFAVILGIVGLVWYPLKRLAKKFKSSKATKEKGS